MNKKINIEAEGGELILRNKAGDHVIIPKNMRSTVKRMIDDDCHGCIDNYVNSLPIMKDYAEDGTVVPINELNPDPLEKPFSTHLPQQKEELVLARADMKPKSVIVNKEKPNHFSTSVPKELTKSNILPEATVTAKKQYEYSSCVRGLCGELARNANMNVNDYKSLNNMYGDAWTIGNAAFAKQIDVSNGYNNLQEGDIINLSREAFKSDKARGIPNKNQHVGYISKIQDGVPYVKHYMSNVGKNSEGKPYGEYFEEPITNISERFKYNATGAFRLNSAKVKNEPVVENIFKFDNKYEPNEIEKDFEKIHQNKRELQQILGLDSNEYDEISRIAYGIIGSESDFGRSSRTLYRMAVPDVVQKAVKIARDMARESNDYDDITNNLSQGYSSTKESSLRTVTDNRTNELKAIQKKVGVNPDGIWGSDTKNAIEAYNKNNPKDKIEWKTTEEKLRLGDYDQLTRNNNYLNNRFLKMGLNVDNLENGENSGKAVMATLSWFKHRFPNATEEDLIRLYTGKKDITAYKQKYDGYMNNIDSDPENNLSYTTKQNLYGELSILANKTNSSLKELRSVVASAIRDYSPLPITADAIIGDLVGAKETITEKALSNTTKEALTKIVARQVKEGKMYLDYNAYFPEISREERMGVSGGTNQISTSAMSRMLSPEGLLQNFLGQATIVDLGNNEYEVIDTYDFNDQGKSFGFISDMKTRGPSVYNVFRSLGRNYGSADGQGAKVKIKLHLDPSAS